MNNSLPPAPPKPPGSRVKIMTILEVAEFLRLSETTVRRMCERKELPAVKFGSQWRILEEDVLAMFDQPWRKNAGALRPSNILRGRQGMFHTAQS